MKSLRETLFLIIFYPTGGCKGFLFAFLFNSTLTFTLYAIGCIDKFRLWYSTLLYPTMSNSLVLWSVTVYIHTISLYIVLNSCLTEIWWKTMDLWMILYPTRMSFCMATSLTTLSGLLPQLPIRWREVGMQTVRSSNCFTGFAQSVFVPGFMLYF